MTKGAQRRQTDFDAQDTRMSNKRGRHNITNWWCDDRGTSVAKDRLSYAEENIFSKLEGNLQGGKTTTLKGQSTTKGIEDIVLVYQQPHSHRFRFFKSRNTSDYMCVSLSVSSYVTVQKDLW